MLHETSPYCDCWCERWDCFTCCTYFIHDVRWLHLLSLSEDAMKKGNSAAGNASVWLCSIGIPMIITGAQFVFPSTCYHVAKRIAAIMEREGVIPPARMRGSYAINPDRNVCIFLSQLHRTEQLRQEFAFSATMGASVNFCISSHVYARYLWLKGHERNFISSDRRHCRGSFSSKRFFVQSENGQGQNHKSL